MITKEQIDSVLNKYGFTRSIFSTDNKMHTYTNSAGIAVIVNAEDNTFEIKYSINYDIFTLESPSCGPLYEEELKYNQFDRIYRKFRGYYLKLI